MRRAAAGHRGRVLRRPPHPRFSEGKRAAGYHYRAEAEGLGALDLAVMRMSIEGLTHLPAFLIHDSPREADLGLGVYHRLFHFVCDLENGGDGPSFQYIVTTTTSPPSALRTDPWLVETLGGAAEDRLLRRDL